jgi:hypothetical protein
LILIQIQPQKTMSHSIYTAHDYSKLDTKWRAAAPEEYSSKMMVQEALFSKQWIAIPSSCLCWNKVWLVNGFTLQTFCLCVHVQVSGRSYILQFAAVGRGRKTKVSFSMCSRNISSEVKGEIEKQWRGETGNRNSLQ